MPKPIPVCANGDHVPHLRIVFLSGVLLLSMAHRVSAQNAPKTGMMQMPVVVPLFIENSVFTSRLVMVNDSLVSTYADVMLRGLNGEHIGQQRVTVAANSQQRLEIGAVLRASGSPATAGSIEIMQSPDVDGQVILAQLAMTYIGSSTPSYVDEETAMPSSDSSPMLRAVADSGYGSPVIAITSIAEASQNVVVECLVGPKIHSKTVQLSAGETVVTDACSGRTVHGADLDAILNEQRDEQRRSQPAGIALTSDGKPGSFTAFALARHGNEDEEDRYFSSI